MVNASAALNTDDRFGLIAVREILERRVRKDVDCGRILGTLWSDGILMSLYRTMAYG